LVELLVTMAEDPGDDVQDADAAELDVNKGYVRAALRSMLQEQQYAQMVEQVLAQLQSESEHNKDWVPFRDVWDRCLALIQQ
jgi:hypothetical protein